MYEDTIDLLYGDLSGSTALRQTFVMQMYFL